MVVGVLRLRLAVYESTSLKDKRRVVKGLKDRLGGEFNVSIAEIGSLDHRQQAELAVAMVGNDHTFVESCLHKIVDQLRRHPSASLVDFEVELL